LQSLIEANAGKVARVLSALVDRGDTFAVARPQRRVMAGAERGEGERRAPRATAQNRDPRLVRHALAPRLPEPIIGLALSSSGQRERGANDMPSSPLARPARIRSSPAQAIIAAL